MGSRTRGRYKVGEKEIDESSQRIEYRVRISRNPYSSPRREAHTQGKVIQGGGVGLGKIGDKI
jgi:hypothetical protein